MARIVACLGLALVACASNAEGPLVAKDKSPETSEPKPAEPAAVVDPLCATQPRALTDHPWAITHASAMGRNLRNVRAFGGRLYFGYGDLNENTGPVEIASFDPMTKTWAHHLTLMTESIERYVVVGDRLFAPCADAHANLKDSCELAVGDGNHEWKVRNDIGDSIHVMDVTERVPGEILVGGSAIIPDTVDSPGAFIWASKSGPSATYDRIFPLSKEYAETGGGPFSSLASLKGITYAVTNSSVWTWDGTTWLHARAPGNSEPILLGEFWHPVNVADHLVFATFGNYLWKFDGAKSVPLNRRTIDTPTAGGFTETPIPIFEEAEGRLLLVDDKGDVQMSNDLTNFKCIGKAPADVRSVGALNGIVYFGGADGHVYSYEKPSW